MLISVNVLTNCYSFTQSRKIRLVKFGVQVIQHPKQVVYLVKRNLKKIIKNYKGIRNST